MPKSQIEKWFKPGKPTGWSKTLSARVRRSRVLAARNGDALAAGRALMALSNVTTDKTTKRLARADALYFYEKHRKEKK